MSREWIYYFGYGSLVNRDTRPADEPAIPARLTGWKRVWGHRVQSVGQHTGCCSLSVLEATGAIDGVVVRMPATDLPILDIRESGYTRLSIPVEHLELNTEIKTDKVFMYQSEPENRGYAKPTNPILQSYVDCVMAGYVKLFGESGLEAFMRSTDGWQGSIENDRHEPRYPRAVELTQQEQSRIDQALYNIIHGYN